MWKRAMRGLGRGIGLLLVVGACILAALRGAGPDAAQRQARQVLDDAAPTGRHNAFALLWVLGHAVPTADLARAMAADAARLAKDADASLTSRDMAVAGYPALPVPPQAQRCGLGDEGCLHKLRAQVKDAAAWLQRYDGLGRQLAALEAADHYRWTLPGPVQASPPGLGLLGLLPTVRAVQFLGGAQAPAIEATCRDLQMWRRLSARSDSLVLTIVALQAIGGSARLLADMHMEAAPHASWPAACEAAIAPLQPEETSLCAAMHGEMAVAEAAMRMTAQGIGEQPWYRRLSAPLVFDVERSLGAIAQARARLCGADVAAAVQQDGDPPLAPWQPPAFLSRTCLGNAAGCILLNVGEPVDVRYLAQRQDAGAQLHLLRTWRWLRTQPPPVDDQALVALLARVPADIGMPRRTLVLADDGRALAMPLKRPGAAPAQWRLPL